MDIQVSLCPSMIFYLFMFIILCLLFRSVIKTLFYCQCQYLLYVSILSHMIVHNTLNVIAERNQCFIQSGYYTKLPAVIVHCFLFSGHLLNPFLCCYFSFCLYLHTVYCYWEAHVSIKHLRTTPMFRF